MRCFGNVLTIACKRGCSNGDRSAHVRSGGRDSQHCPVCGTTYISSIYVSAVQLPQQALPRVVDDHLVEECDAQNNSWMTLRFAARSRRGVSRWNLESVHYTRSDCGTIDRKSARDCCVGVVLGALFTVGVAWCRQTAATHVLGWRRLRLKTCMRLADAGNRLAADLPQVCVLWRTGYSNFLARPGLVNDAIGITLGCVDMAWFNHCVRCGT